MERTYVKRKGKKLLAFEGVDDSMAYYFKILESRLFDLTLQIDNDQIDVDAQGSRYTAIVLKKPEIFDLAITQEQIKEKPPTLFLKIWTSLFGGHVYTTGYHVCLTKIEHVGSGSRYMKTLINKTLTWINGSDYRTVEFLYNSMKEQVKRKEEYRQALEKKKAEVLVKKNADLINKIARGPRT